MAFKLASGWTARVRFGFCEALMFGAIGGALAQGRALVVTVRATKHAYHNAPVSVALPAPDRTARRSGYLQLDPLKAGDGKPLRAQAGVEGGRMRLTFVLDDLPMGATRSYRLSTIQFVRAPDRQVEVTQKDSDVAISFDSTLFTRYTTHAAPNKPVFYPILTPEGDAMTRRWPVEPEADPGESHDHPHHRGLWFTHSSVNGVDYWSEGAKTGRTVNTGFERLESGWVYGGFTAKTEWRDPANQLVATDRREIRIYELPDGDRVMDFTITITPAGGPVTFGDNKDGMFGLRVPDTLAIHPDRSSKIKGEGHIETSTGVNGTAAWGKPADWVDYWGPIGGKTYGVAMMDAPTNLRHPETWHARDYALFTVNPFGLHDFGRGEKGAGDYTVSAGKMLTFTYRVLFHHGDTKAADIADAYTAFADPPEATAK
ncbi:MAG TPA: PmoA family protein [Chthonomonadaceae bacterium]|nr:PmoA family protein [Chthonomonadaceae bacterium]